MLPILAMILTNVKKSLIFWHFHCPTMIPAGCEFSYSLFCCILKTGPEPMYWTSSIHSFSRLKFQLTVVAIFQIDLETSSNLTGSYTIEKVKYAFGFKAILFTGIIYTAAQIDLISRFDVTAFSCCFFFPNLLKTWLYFLHSKTRKKIYIYNEQMNFT